MAQRHTTRRNRQAQLISCPIDTKLAQSMGELDDLLPRRPDILAAIEADQDRLALARKAPRVADRAALAAATPNLPCLDLDAPLPEVESLEVGRPRMRPEAVCHFLLMRGHFGSLSGANWELASDSSTARHYLDPYLRHNKWPGASTVLDNLNALSNHTRQLILTAQAGIAMTAGLDDFCLTIIDSTAIKANSDFPTDSGTILKLLTRVWESGSRTLKRAGVDTWQRHWTEKWLAMLKCRDFAINTAKTRRERAKHYRKFLNTAGKLADHLEREAAAVEEPLFLGAFDLPPSRRQRLLDAWKKVVTSLIQAHDMIEYSYLRQFGTPDLPAPDRERYLASVSDPDASFIKKGRRPVVFGYKAQIARSGNGLVTAVHVPEGNVPDCLELEPLVRAHRLTTGVVPEAVSVDDGYSSAAGRQDVLGLGVKDVSISGSKGKKLTPAELYDSDRYRKLRNVRSTVESLIFVLKHDYEYGELRRRGIAGVRAELLEKAIAYNFHRLAILRRARAEAVPDARCA